MSALPSQTADATASHPAPYPHLFAPARPGLHHAAQPRVMGSMHTGLEDRARDFPKLAAYFAERARGGVGPDRHRRHRAERRRLAQAVRAASCRGRGEVRAASAGHRGRARARRHDRLQILHAGRYALPPVVGRAVAAEGADQPVHAARAVGARRRAPDRRLRALRASSRARPATTASRSWAPRATSSTSSSPPRTNQRNDALGRRRSRTACASRSRSCAACARPCGPDFIIIYRLSMLDLVEGGSTGTRSCRWRRRSKPRARRSSTPASAGTRRASRPSPPRCRARAFAGVTAQAARPHVGAAADRDQPHQHARRRRSACSPTATPTWCRWRARCSPTRSSSNKAARRPRGRDQHLHRLQPGLPRPRLREQARQLPGQSARLPRDRADRTRPTPRRRRIAVVGAGPAGPRLRDGRRRARPSRHAVRRRARDRRPVQPRQAHPGQGGVPRDAALLPPSQLDDTGVDAAARHARRRRRRCARLRRRSCSPPASRRAQCRLPGHRPSEGRAATSTCSTAAWSAARSVAIIGAGGIGFDVAEFLVHDGPVARARCRRRWMARMGRRPDASKRAAACAPPQPEPPARQVWLLQRSRRQARRAARQDHRLDPPRHAQGERRAHARRRGLRRHRRRGPAHPHRRHEQTAARRHVVICAGQEPRRELFDALAAHGRDGAPHRRRRRRRRTRRQARDRPGHPLAASSNAAGS